MKSSRLVLLIFPLLLGSSRGCIDLSPVEKSIEQINRTMELAVQTLGQQSASWQTTLVDLENQLAEDAKDMEEQIARDVNLLVEKVDFLAKDGIQFSQESINCQAEIIGTRTKIALQNLLNEFLNKYEYKGINNRPLLPYEPTVCTVNPPAVELARWQGVSGQLVLSGIDFNILDTAQPLAYVRKVDNTEQQVPATYVARQTNYRIAINVSALISDRFFDNNSRQLEIRWAGRRVNPNQINIVPDVTPPPPPPTCGARGQPCCTGRESCTNSVCSRGTCKTFTVSGTTWSSPNYGGGGGSGFGPDTCDGGNVAIGLAVRAGGEVDNIALKCNRLAADGQLGGTSYTTTNRGGGGGTLYDVACPNGQVLVGIEGRAGGRIDQLKGKCASPLRVAGGEGDQSSIGPWGGTGGAAFQANCEGPRAVVGISGRSGSRVDQIRVHCGDLRLE